MNKVLEINDLSFSYDKDYILKDISFELSSGEFIAIVGENGSGKSTLLNLILSNLTPNSGKIKLFGDNILNDNHYRDIAYISQNAVNSYRNFPTTINELINNHLKYLKIKVGLEEYLKMVGLEEHRYKSLRQLSGGQLQRVGIVLALIKDASLILLDEPTSAIDKKFSRELFTILRKLSEKGKTIVIVTHELAEITDYVDYIIHLRGARAHKHNINDWKELIKC